MKRLMCTLAVFASVIGVSYAEEAAQAKMETKMEKKDAIVLPAPDMTAGKALQKAIADRKSTRDYSDKEVSPEALSTILWSAGGISRPDGKRTAGSTCNWQSVDIYVMLKCGIYFYNAKANSLEQVASGDFSQLAGMQDFAKTVPVTILFVGDLDKMKIPDMKKKYLYLGFDAGLMSENVYLTCASLGLGTVLRGSVESDPLIKAMKLPENKVVLAAQSVGWGK